MTDLTALALARRIKSRLAKLTSGYAAGPFHGPDASAFMSFTASDGRHYRGVVSPIIYNRIRPTGFDHIFGDRRPIDQLRLAEYASKAIGEMARVSKNDIDVANLDPWHKKGVAGFVVRATFGKLFLVEIREISTEEQLEEAREATAGTEDDEDES